MKSPLAAMAALSISAAATAQVCQAPSFETINPSLRTEDRVPVRVTNLMRIGLSGSIQKMGFDPQGFAATFKDGRKLLLQFDDASLAHRNNGVTAKAGPLMRGMLTGSTADGCKLLQTARLDRHDYRVRFTRGTVTVFAYGAGTKYEFVVIHDTKPDTVIQGLARDFDRQAFEDLISSIQPPEQE